MRDTVTFEVEIEKDVDFLKIPLIKQYIESQGLAVNLQQQQTQNQNLESSQFTQQQINTLNNLNNITYNWRGMVDFMKELDKMINYSPF